MALVDWELTGSERQVLGTVWRSAPIARNQVTEITGLGSATVTRLTKQLADRGLIQETTENDRSGIPILKDLPLIKYIASSTKNTKSRNELLVFIQPRIVSDTSDLPVTAQDPTGSSPFGTDATKFLTQEHADPAADVKAVHRSTISSMIHKLFE